ncbi:DNA-directed RNA polymerase III subunit rpc25 [Scheffersomyces spartinae]|uniref:DNA-directed RNA polymerase subunit n=1 Tax=Scheffersomyces spartinae TaxID=45513 RepID=A0A9P8AH64_9ASCO|nr:DNA-directed RNA polymerase III subunit rpc25 [Scheffersomyces spartinae]KAG7191817.1 DNA-directed RNA polymerase III subunit rpc25 [Scheffersomyces spartinae]
MYILSEIEDLIRVPPSSFNVPIKLSVTDELHQKYSNRVVGGLGLVVAVWDVLQLDDGLIRPGDGGVFVGTRFRCIVWKPFAGEILGGWVLECLPLGIKVRMGFFDEIFIKKEYLFEGCEYKEAEKAWVWKPDADTELYIDVNEKIRFRVEEEVFNDVKATELKATDGNTQSGNEKPSYVIIGSCQVEGTGCVSWWE